MDKIGKYKSCFIEEVKCLNCGRHYERRTKRCSSKRTRNNVKKKNSVNCSQKCSREWEKERKRRNRKIKLSLKN